MPLGETSANPPKLSWRARARLRAGLPLRKRGGQPGNINRMTHGRYSGHLRRRRAFTRNLVHETNALIATLKLIHKLDPTALQFKSNWWGPLQSSEKVSQRGTNSHLPLVGRSTRISASGGGLLPQIRISPFSANTRRAPPGMLRIPTSPQGGGEVVAKFFQDGSRLRLYSRGQGKTP